MRLDDLETQRTEFFKKAREDLRAGVDPIVWESELNQLWPGPNGGYDEMAAFQAFQREDLHWSWGNPNDLGASEQA